MGYKGINAKLSQSIAAMLQGGILREIIVGGRVKLCTGAGQRAHERREDIDV